MEWTPELSQQLFGFISGLIGAVVGGLFTLYATRTELRANEKTRARAEAADVRSLLDSLRVELDTLWTFHQLRIGDAVEKLAPGQPLLYYYPLSQDYFTIYNSNAASIGRLDDDVLRRAIVTTYNKCKKVVDGFIYNNLLFQDYRREMMHADDGEPDQRRVQARLQELKDYAEIIRKDHFELKRYMEELLSLLSAQKTP